MKKWNKKKIIVVVSICVVTIITLLAIKFAKFAEPENPIEANIDISSSIDSSTENGNDNDIIIDNPKEDVTQPNDDTVIDDNPIKSDDSKEKDTLETEEEEKSQDSIELREDKNTKSKNDYNGYFSTNLKDNQILDSKIFNLNITQKSNKLTVEKTEVYVNKTQVKPFQGKLYFEEGSNSVKVVITYKTEKNNTLVIVRNYTVQVQLNRIIIDCDLEDGMVADQPSLLFHAKAKMDGKEVSCQVSLNDNLLSGENGSYECLLREDVNTIKIVAQSGKKKAVATYLVYYEKIISNYAIETDLANKETNLAKHKFYVTVKNNGVVTKDYTISINGTYLETVQSDYTVDLVAGKNKIEIVAGSGSRQIKNSYEITYVPYVLDLNDGSNPGNSSGGNNDDNKEEEKPEEEVKNPPILYTDLVDQSTIYGTTLSFYTEPVDYKGNRIRASGVVVTCNGETISHVWDDSTKTSYRMELVNGSNDIRIALTDTEGNSLTYPFTIYCNSVGTGESLGYVTFSVEATTIGQGYLIPPTQVEIFQGDNSVKILKDLLTANGYTYQFTGTESTGFYLSHIKGENIISNPFVNPELEEHLNNTGCDFRLDKYSSNSLGEFDFSTGSGWMYSVNGIYPNYGFSDCFPHDGDVIRVRFTLYMGKDIMGGYAMGDGNDENWGDW